MDKITIARRAVAACIIGVALFWFEIEVVTKQTMDLLQGFLTMALILGLSTIIAGVFKETIGSLLALTGWGVLICVAFTQGNALLILLAASPVLLLVSFASLAGSAEEKKEIKIEGAIKRVPIEEGLTGGIPHYTVRLKMEED